MIKREMSRKRVSGREREIVAEVLVDWSRVIKAKRVIEVGKEIEVRREIEGRIEIEVIV